jgi:hypothetical protein
MKQPIPRVIDNDVERIVVRGVAQRSTLENGKLESLPTNRWMIRKKTNAKNLRSLSKIIPLHYMGWSVRNPEV